MADSSQMLRVCMAHARQHGAAMPPESNRVLFAIALPGRPDQLKAPRPRGLESVENGEVRLRDLRLDPRPSFQQVMQPAIICGPVDHFIRIALYRLLELLGVNAVAAVKKLLVRQ